MKKLFAVLLVLFLAAGITCASAQTVSCAPAGFSLTLPDSFAPVPRSSSDDRDLVLHFSDGGLDLTVYVSFAGSGNPFQVLTGDETDFGPVRIGGTDMFYTRGQDSQGSWISYSWMHSPDAVALYFVWNGNDQAALRLIGEIMESVVFD